MTVTKSLKKNIEHLCELQGINQELDDLLDEIDILKEEAEQEERKYETRQNQYNKQKPTLDKAQEEYEQIKIELEEIKNGIESLEEKKKKIKTIKEFKAVNKEIEYLSKKNAIRKNDFITKGEEVEYKQAKLEKILESINEIKTIIDKKKEDIENLIKERNEAINDLTNQKKNLEAKIPSNIITTFKRIYKNQFHTAVVAVYKKKYDGSKDLIPVCDGCNMQIPLQTEINVREEKELTFCPSCSRILYYEPDAEDDDLEALSS